ncbi:MAG TPA: DUF6134 family protein [Gemmatimonadaceae bacterium]|jgi:hypothetical protein|nr:DUF6134 family protein [Gemmatimonadaceae bacterium]
MPIRSVCFALFVAILPSAAPAQRGKIVDEGTFTVTKPGAPPFAESFRITRTENDLLQATAQSTSGSRRITSRLIADSTGLPTDYGLVVLEGRDTLFRVRVAGAGSRLSATSSNRRGDESMREYPSAPATIIVDDDLVHLAYFAAVGQRTGSVHLINPRTGATAAATVGSQGQESIEIGGKPARATHYVMNGGPIRRDFWLDSAGRLLRLETSTGLKAIREELPR